MRGLQGNSMAQSHGGSCKMSIQWLMSFPRLCRDLAVVAEVAVAVAVSVSRVGTMRLTLLCCSRPGVGYCGCGLGYHVDRLWQVTVTVTCVF